MSDWTGFRKHGPAGDIAAYEVADLLTSLVEKSLVVFDEESGRYRRLETVRAYGRAVYQDSLAIRRELGDRPGIAASLNNLGLVAFEQGDYPAARALYEESLAIRRELGDRRGIALSLGNLGTVAFEQGDHLAARAL